MVALLMADPITLGKRLASLRKERKMSMMRLAAAAGVNQSNVYQLETGRITDPRFSTLLGLARALGIDVGELVGGITQTASQPEAEKRPRRKNAKKEDES